MAICDLCGKDGNLNNAIIENAKLDVCSSCSRHGKIISYYQEPLQQKKEKLIIIEEPQEGIISNYSELLKSSREKRNMTIKEVSQAIAVKESVISKIESGSLNLDFNTAKKLETFFKLKLITKHKKYEYAPEKTEKSSFTIGDILKGKL